MESSNENNKSHYVVLFVNDEGCLEAFEKKYDDITLAKKICQNNSVIYHTQCYVAHIVFEAHPDVYCVSGELE
jgi:hypothetical protein